jgi:hypothetical protein
VENGENEAGKTSQDDCRQEKESFFDDAINSTLREHPTLVPCLHNPDLYLRECLKLVFLNLPDIVVFCSARLPRVSQNIFPGDNLDAIVQLRIIEYCRTHNKYEEVWEALKEERSAQYAKFYPLWCKIKEKKILKRYQNYSGKAEFAGQRKPQSDDESNDPLVVGNEEEVVRWFHKEFTPSEQGLIVATALFQGINRKHVAFLASSIETILFSSVQREQGVD